MVGDKFLAYATEKPGTSRNTSATWVKPDARIMSRSITVTEDGESASGWLRRIGDNTTGNSSRKSDSVIAAPAATGACQAAAQQERPSQHIQACLWIAVHRIPARVAHRVFSVSLYEFVRMNGPRPFQSSKTEYRHPCRQTHCWPGAAPEPAPCPAGCAGAGATGHNRHRPYWPYRRRPCLPASAYGRREFRSRTFSMPSLSVYLRVRIEPST